MMRLNPRPLSELRRMAENYEGAPIVWTPVPICPTQQRRRAIFNWRLVKPNKMMRLPERMRERMAARSIHRKIDRFF
jgi:hypothetical protein